MDLETTWIQSSLFSFWTSLSRSRMPPRTQMDTGLGNEIEWEGGNDNRAQEFRHIRRCVAGRLLIWLTSLSRSLDLARSARLAAWLLLWASFVFLDRWNILVEFSLFFCVSKFLVVNWFVSGTCMPFQYRAHGPRLLCVTIFYVIKDADITSHFTLVIVVIQFNSIYNIAKHYYILNNTITVTNNENAVKFPDLFTLQLSHCFSWTLHGFQHHYKDPVHIPTNPTNLRLWTNEVD